MTGKMERRTNRAAVPSAAAVALLAGIVLLPAAVAIAAEANEPAAPAASAEADAAASEIYRTRCELCHGETGKGDGPGGMALDPRPRDFGDPSWQSAVTDEYVERIIARGGVAVGKSPSMPPNPDLQSKPEVVKALRRLVRAFAKK